MDLEELRKKVDLIDSQIIKLLNSRMEYALRSKRLKSQISDSEREKQIMERVEKNSNGLIRPQFSQTFFGEIINESKKLQNENYKLAGFQGEHGAYSEVAVKSLERDLVPIPCQEFPEVFESVQKGYLDLGVVPVENSLEGAVTQVNDLLVETDLKIVGSLWLPIKHCLLTIPDTDYHDIKVVYSHPQALGQCRSFLSRNKLEARPFYDTAGAAMMLANERPKAAAAIASKLL